jgi:hypothetical protein
LSNWCWKRLARRKPFRWPLISRSAGKVALVGTLHHDLNLSAATFGKILRKELTFWELDELFRPVAG